jgi:hypothetical protein
MRRRRRVASVRQTINAAVSVGMSPMLTGCNGPRTVSAPSTAAPNQAIGTATRLPMTNHNMTPSPNTATEAINSNQPHPPAARKAPPGNHNPQPKACHAGDAPSKVGNIPTAHTAA